MEMKKRVSVTLGNVVNFRLIFWVSFNEESFHRFLLTIYINTLKKMTFYQKNKRNAEVLVAVLKTS